MRNRALPYLALLAGSLACGRAAGAGAGEDSYPAPDGFAEQPWAGEDRVVIGDFSRVVAVAAGAERVWMVSPDAVLGWDHRFRRWDGPYSMELRGSLERIQWALVDPLDQSLWLAHTGGWLHWQPELRVWDGGTTPVAIRGIAFDGADGGAGLYLRTARGWLLVPRGSSVATISPGPARPVGPPTLTEALAENPSFAASSGTLLDARLRPVRLTSATESWDGQGWYFGTWGAGTLYVEQGFPRPEPLRYGLAGERIGALLATPEGVWAANDRSVSADAAVTLVGRELERFEVISGAAATGLPFTAARALLRLDDELWAATDAGAARIELEDGRTTIVGESRGLPDPRVLALARRGDAIIVGTEHGAARIEPDSLRAERIAPNEAGAVSAVVVLRDTTWVGTESGVRFVAAGGGELLAPRELATAAFARPVLDMARTGDTLVALTRDAVYWRDAAGAWTIGPDPTLVLGELGYLAVDERGLWVVGDRAIGFVRPGFPPVPVVRPEEVPGVVTALAVDERYLWVGTTQGLVRFRLSAIRP